MASEYLPKQAEILSVKKETADTSRFRMKFVDPADREAFEYQPGQFVEISVMGAGEVPISITSSPLIDKGYFELCIRDTGKVTREIHKLGEGDIVGIRGPYGNSFDIKSMQGKEVLFVVGGLGLAPLRPVINGVVASRDEYKGVKILYGARTPGDMLFNEDLDEWSKIDGVEVLTTVDRADDSWKGNVGVVPKLFEKTEIEPKKTVAVICGPGIMIKFVMKDLLGMGFKEKDIWLTMERHMKCGIGKCGHCNIGTKYVCIDGPVFTFDQIKDLPDPY